MLELANDSLIRQVMEKALISALKDMLGESYTEDVSNAWRDIFQFMSGTMMTGKEKAKEQQITADLIQE